MLPTCGLAVQVAKVGLVGGSDLSKQMEQLGPNSERVRAGAGGLGRRRWEGCLRLASRYHGVPPPFPFPPNPTSPLRSAVLQEFDYVFSENGLVAYKEGEQIAVQSLSGYLGEQKLKEFINFTLKYLAGG